MKRNGQREGRSDLETEEETGRCLTTAAISSMLPSGAGESPSLPPIPINQSRFPLQSSSTGSCLVHSFPLTKPTNPSSTDKGIASIPESFLFPLVREKEKACMINSIHFQKIATCF